MWSIEVQSLEYETEKTVLIRSILWHKNFVCKNCETNLGSECAPKPSWPTGFEKSKIHQPNAEKLQFKGSKIQGILLDLRENAEKLSSKNAWILLPLNCNFSGLGWWILNLSKHVGQEEALVHILKLSLFHNSCKQNCYVTKCPKTVIFSVSYSSDCMLFFIAF